MLMSTKKIAQPLLIHSHNEQKLKGNNRIIKFQNYGSRRGYSESCVSPLFQNRDINHSN